MNFNNLDEILQSLGYIKKEQKQEYTGKKTSENYNKADSNNSESIKGFQDIDPLFLSIITEVTGNILSGKMPINVADSFANWIMLIAQVISTYNAQQQYQEAGPGRCFNSSNKDIDNNYNGNINKKENKKKPRYDILELYKEINNLKIEIHNVQEDNKLIKEEINSQKIMLEELKKLLN